MSATAGEGRAAGPALSSVSQRTPGKARTLVDAMPYFLEHAGSTVVIKVGGAVMDESSLAVRLAEDLSLLRLIGVRPAHRAWRRHPQIGDFSKQLGIEPVFVDGHRVTDARTLELARMVLAGKVNQELVALLNANGVTAVGLVRRRRPTAGGAAP